MREADKPLAEIRVLDLTRLLPGAFCTQLLADLGADVIKVEEPETGDYMRWTPPLVDGQSSLFDALNRGKRSVALDLKMIEGRDALLRLAERADVLVEGNRPGVMARLGLGWDALHARNPRLVMCSITGYGQDGPYASRAGHDLNYMAIAGALGLNGERGGPPVPLSVQVADIGGGGLQPAVAILGALVAVQRGGKGRWIDAAMTDSAAGWMALVFAAHGAGERVARGDQRLSGRYACYRVYECADGRHYSVAALEPKFWKALCGALDLPDLVEQQYAEDMAVQGAMEDIFRSRSRDEWEAKLSGLDACCEPVLDVDEVSTHPQIVARGLLNRKGRGPRLGEHTEEVLREIGL
ncbi:MAG TPA: CaiB/BaiF CoA-transferase family protein [Candidatus Dormibacteraeota bacterium]|nr:CaiB/BaiF CoA-transferase family protein [Candidatus Dormibacteraeota bacterium]